MFKTSSILILIIFLSCSLNAFEKNNDQNLVNFYLKVKSSKHLLKNNQLEQVKKNLETILEEIILDESQGATQIQRLIEQSSILCKKIACTCNQEKLSTYICQLEEKEMELDALCEEIKDELEKTSKSCFKKIDSLKPYTYSAAAIFAYTYLNYKHNLNFSLKNSFYSNLKPAGIISGIIFIISQIWDNLKSYIKKPSSKVVNLRTDLKTNQEKLLQIYQTHKSISSNKQIIDRNLKTIIELLNKNVTAFVIEKIKEYKQIEGRSEIFKDLELTTKPEQLLLKCLSEN